MESPSAQLIEPSMLDVDGPPSSPFVTEVGSRLETQSRSPSKQWEASLKGSITEENTENIPPGTPSKHSIMDMPMAEEDKENVPERATSAASSHSRPSSSLHRRSSNEMMPPPSTRKVSGSPRKSPLKANRSGATTPQPLSRGNSDERTPSESASAFQAGLDMRSAMMPPEEQQPYADDTCASTFSEIPDMTVFAKLRQSPTKTRTPGRHAESTPRTSRKRSSPSRSPSPTPRRLKSATPAIDDNTTTNFLIDFTQQMEMPTVRPGSPFKSSTESNLLQYIHNQRSPTKSPAKQNVSTPTKSSSIMNLLDFELPPAPTPRSVPTITVRELESLKSSYLSQISSLKATLSGREAEVDSLKKAVSDAERRAGEAQESLSDERCKREYAEQEIAGWKKRGQEFEVVLKSVKEEVLKADVEKEETARRLEETEKREADAEARAVRAEERFLEALSARAAGDSGDSNEIEERVQCLVSAQIDAKIESVSRELHTVYKEKHERKVATLKKSYEARNEKKTAELQSRVSELEKSNDELQAARDATFSGPVNDSMMAKADNIELKSQMEEQKAALARLESEMETSKQQQEQLMRELQQERIEKGDLVAAVDEMLALQSEPPATPAGLKARDVVEDFRKSISRPPSGLRAPAPSGIPGGASGGESRIGRGLPTPGGLNRSTSGGAGKSRMLANIERMGRSGGHGNGVE